MAYNGYGWDGVNNKVTSLELSISELAASEIAPATPADNAMDVRGMFDCQDFETISVDIYTTRDSGSITCSLYWWAPPANNNPPSQVALDWTLDSTAAVPAQTAGTATEIWKREKHYAFSRTSATAPIKGRYLYPTVSNPAGATTGVKIIVTGHGVA